MNSPKTSSNRARDVDADADPAVAALENASEEELSEEERIAFEAAMTGANDGISSEELLERLRSKP